MNLEEKLWDYIDGFCSEEELKAMDLLIETDENIRNKYLELKALQDNLSALELEEPAMNFTFSVMESVRKERILKPLKTRVDHRIIFVISAFFIGCIMLLLGYIFLHVDWHSSAKIQLPEIKMPAVNAYFSATVVKGFLFFDLVLALFFADHYFRKLFFDRK